VGGGKPRIVSRSGDKLFFAGVPVNMQPADHALALELFEANGEAVGFGGPDGNIAKATDADRRRISRIRKAFRAAGAEPEEALRIVESVGGGRYRMNRTPAASGD
jgi:hypothetical protein